MPTSLKKEPRVHVLGIVGSPRRQGNTEILADEVLAGAQATGAQTEKVILTELQITPCLACGTCQTTGTCAQQDDMPALLDKMQHSQVWVLGTPIYWAGPTAQFKAFMDSEARKPAFSNGEELALSMEFLTLQRQPIYGART